MTSFDQPDAGLLVEHLLPSLLGTSQLSQELQERMLFFGELGTALEALHGRLTVISSPPHEAREAPQYPWLWRYVNHFIVGAKSRAVQHAKLWAFHWKVDDEDLLELYVSSTNLTASAFKGQLQAGWRVMLTLGKRGSPSAQKSWGELVPFLGALGVSAGSVATTRIQRLLALLSRVECPEDVTFIASIPGGKSAARQLKQFKISKIHVLAPTIGEWQRPTLFAWSGDIGLSTGKIHLIWISTKHPWAETPGWALASTTKATLEKNGVQIECLPNEARFTKQHRDADPRWSHAKLYLLRSGRKRRLLVTSANWSISAWGAGKTAPRNFELGVVFESAWTDLEAIGEPFNPPDTIPFCSDRVEEKERSSSLEWAEATWDGIRIDLLVRSTDTSTPVTVTISFVGGMEREHALVDRTASVPWKDPECTPLSARFIQGSDLLEVDIIDLRPPAQFTKTPLPEIDPALAGALRDAFLLQRYGGPSVDIESIPGLDGERRLLGVADPATNYSVQAWTDARAAFDVVDQWRAALQEAKGDFQLLQRVRLDGQGLRALYARRDGPAAALAVEELDWRIGKEI
jgi:hypothetical protein